MCGFVVTMALNSGQPDLGKLARATDLLAHRGPDDSGRFVEGGVGIGFRRLSIFDLSEAGHQPMFSADNRYIAAFNGAIYNFVELRAELERLGHRFRSRADTEVLLAAYIEWGSACVERFNGMWSFVIYDRVAKRLFGSRDRFGIKPLFWYLDDGALIFASEIKAIRDSGLAELEVDQGALAAFLLEGVLDHDEGSFYKGVRHVPAGVTFEADLSGRLSWRRYWSVLDSAQAIELPSDPPAAFGALFDDAVRLRLRGDVPVGVLLSGGVDSSSIICSMARQRGATTSDAGLSALCYMDPRYDETQFIDATLAQTRASLKRLDVEPEAYWDTFERVVWHQDEPVHSINAVVGYHLMRLASAHGLKVVLNGHGADETLAGYPGFFTAYWIELLRGRRWLTLHRSLRAAVGANGGSMNAYSKVMGACIGQSMRHVPGYLALARRRRRARLEQASWVSEDVKRHWRPSDLPVVRDLAADLRFSLERSHLPAYLRVEDRNSMAHGIEQRVPFLDHRLVSLAFRLGADWKLRGQKTKVILREAMRGRIPETVRTRAQKFGFPTSVDTWFRGPLYGQMQDMLASRLVRESGVWNLKAVARALDGHRRGELNVGETLFDVVQVCLWLQLSKRPRSYAYGAAEERLVQVPPARCMG